MLIECEQSRPVPSFSSGTTHIGASRLALSALCHTQSQYPQSPSQRSLSPEQASSPFSNPTSIEPVWRQRLPSINDLSFVSSPTSTTPTPQSPSANPQINPQIPSAQSYPHARHLTYRTTPTTPVVRGYPRNLPSSTNCADFPSSEPSSHMSYSKNNTVARSAQLLPHAYDTLQAQSPPTVKEPSNPSYSKRRYSSQTTSRVCTNCAISQTRQWVRGESHAWLCHSCGQFWRKNGYSRPRALWNRPTFKRSSRKSRLANHGEDSSRKLKGSTRQAVSSSFLNGKKMIQWEVRLPPLHHAPTVRDLISTRPGIRDSDVCSGAHASAALAGNPGTFVTSRLHSWRSRSATL